MKLVPPNVDDEVNSLFMLPLSEFTSARNVLAAKLKKSGRADDAVFVKALAKPSISAWAVNQLYWKHRQAFDKLIASGERFHKAQTSGKVADMRTVLDARREALTHLSDLAASVLREAGHNPAPDTIHRITTTLEGVSAYASHDDGPRPGRLTHDVDPPGFESFASFVAPGVKSIKSPPAVAGGSKGARKQSTDLITTNTRKPGKDDDKRRADEARKSKIAAAKVSRQDAKRLLTEARARSQRLEAAQKKAEAEVKKAEMELRKAKAAAEEAARRARSVAEEVEEAASVVDDAERRVAASEKELESLIRE